VAAALSRGQSKTPTLTLVSGTTLGLGNCSLVVYNALGWPQTSLVSLDIAPGVNAIVVTGPTGSTVPAQVREGCPRMPVVPTWMTSFHRYCLALTLACRSTYAQGYPYRRTF
jgi:hypothetical protein